MPCPEYLFKYSGLNVSFDNIKWIVNLCDIFSYNSDCRDALSSTWNTPVVVYGTGNGIMWSLLKQRGDHGKPDFVSCSVTQSGVWCVEACDPEWKCISEVLWHRQYSGMKDKALLHNNSAPLILSHRLPSIKYHSNSRKPVWSKNKKTVDLRRSDREKSQNRPTPETPRSHSHISPPGFLSSQTLKSPYYRG